jgi:tetratricopeptide (TPR) repeat protein
LYNLGRLKEARSAYLRALGILSDDALIDSKLGLTEVRLGMKKNGLARLMKALQANPDEFEMHDRMIKAYILANRMTQAAEAAEHLAAKIPNPATVLRAASIRAHMREWTAAQDIVLRGLQKFPQNHELLQAEAEIGEGVTRV